jgi:hypothetical protein
MTEEPDVLRSAGSVRTERHQTLLDRYGGFDWLASFLGFSVAVFFLTVLLGIVGAIIGVAGFQMGATVPPIGSAIPGATQQLGIAGLVASLIALFLAYLIGGYAAGRLARYDGVKNGLGVVLWTVLIALILAILGTILGASFNVASQLNLQVDAGMLTTVGLISLAVTLLVMLLAAALGGFMGERYHRAIDRDTGALA